MMPPRRFVICGGGTAGWMAANMLAHRWPGAAIELIEAPDIATIGVGEGSTPTLKRFFEVMGIAEADWMPRCQATYKANIRFAGWSPAGAPDYSHPFTTQIDDHTREAFFINCRNRRMGLDVPTAPGDFLLNGVLARQGKAPIAPGHFPFRMEYGYHFDASLLGAFLRDHAVARGVRHRQARILDARRAENGDISSVQTDRGEEIAGDMFLDCSGFSALLIRGKLGVGFTSFRANLFNDAAVVLPSAPKVFSSQMESSGDSENTANKASSGPPPVETLATAMPYGWRWSIPLTSRVGNGYVYSSDYLSPDAAETELRTALGQLDGGQPARHLRFNVGQLERHWAGNVVAVGLSQGFIEPLEATALHLVLNTVEAFMQDYERGQFTPRHAPDFNAKITERIERVRDYIVAHYKLNTRTDTRYWWDNRDNENLSDPLRAILDVWFRRQDLNAELERQSALSHFGSESWHCLLAGYGAFPPVTAPHRDDADFFAQRGVARFLDRCSLNFPSHETALCQI